ncbi:dihydroorotate dehydrogenase electron transfer subunit [Bacillus solimangrovi]|uniref:Dihydroorotate dehydrogenase B (NAD(+)), electron transfer subunit n=1 Tax=Bacillus solimangrovi TaxID=1305675 RepID=A0A1E5LAU3_9BACI|nr:dihydroorotate dehydrogenase electron transfer subunit [Bacillus solimangrovi]OEH91196.1 dihydroorotate dehydrogenase electron transfer subunit [Bacillus solimangrovi]
MKQEQMKLIHQTEIAENIFEIVLEGDMVSFMQPGQFVHVRVHGGADPLLRRPISICNVDEDSKQFTMLYRAEGQGTKLFSERVAGEMIDVLGPLGNGFPVDETKSGETALLVGGGIGVPPLYELSQQLKSQGVNVIHVLGFQTKSAVFYEEKFAKLGETYVATVDGSYGTSGFVTDIINKHKLSFDTLYSCGPIPMLKALEKKFANKKGFISLEQRMGCGIGACFACVCHTPSENDFDYKKVCSDGPVFKFGEVVL